MDTSAGDKSTLALLNAHHHSEALTCFGLRINDLNEQLIRVKTMVADRKHDIYDVVEAVDKSSRTIGDLIEEFLWEGESL